MTIARKKPPSPTLAILLTSGYLRSSVNITARQITEKTASVSPIQLPEPSDPDTTMLTPIITKIIVIHVERFVASRKNNQLKTAATAGVTLRIRNVLAIDVILILNTKPEALPTINTPEINNGQPLSFIACTAPRLSLT